MWTQSQIRSHRMAARLLTKIMRASFDFIRVRNNSVTEFDVHEFIMDIFQENGLRSGKRNPAPIVAFGENTAIIHYSPSKRNAKKLKPDMPILLDIWGKAGNSKAPFADITWFGYRGNSVPEKIQHAFRAIIASRDACARFIHGELKKSRFPTGQQLDSLSQSALEQSGYQLGHELGHILGTASPHGAQWLAGYDQTPLRAGFAYTIEPGVYFDNDFGIRSEMNFLITPKLEFKITTPPQREIVLL